MVKVQLIGTPQTQWNVGKGFIAGGTILEITPEDVLKYKDIAIPLEAVVLEEAVKPEVKKSTKRKVKE